MSERKHTRARTEPRTKEEREFYEKGQQLKQERDDADFVKLMQMPEFRRFMYDELSRCHVFALSFAGADHSVTAFNEGERNVGLRNFNRINELCPELFTTMMADGRREDEVFNDG